jgi:hypothetical protein
MSTADTLAQRIEAAERKAQAAADKLKQLKARKAAIEARQRAAEAKRAQAAEARRILEVGALVKRAGLLQLDNATLLGALLDEADKLVDPDYQAAARQRGQAVLAVRSAQAMDGRA